MNDPRGAAIEAVIAAGAKASARGWTPATAGNFSARIDAETIAITRSGGDKGDLKPDDVAVVDIARAKLDGLSAEAPLHLALYRDHPDVGAVWHAHSPNAVVASRLAEADGAIGLEGWELEKALAGVRTHEARVELIVLANDQDTERLAQAAAERLAEPAGEAARAPGYVLAGHGLYAWGATPNDAWRHLEAIETLLGHELAFRKARS